MSRKPAPHVLAAISRAAQPTPQTQSPARAAHVQAALNANSANAVGRTQARGNVALGVSPMAAHVQRAVQPQGAGGTAQPQTSSTWSPPTSFHDPAPPAPNPGPSPVVQRTKRKFKDFDNGDELYRVELVPNYSSSKKTKIVDVYLDGDSDDDEHEETTKNFYNARKRLGKNSLGPTLRLTGPGAGHLKSLQSGAKSKRVYTEYQGESEAYYYMLNRGGFKLAYSTGVEGGPGLDQVWYKGSLTLNTVTAIHVIEAKGFGAKLSNDQKDGNKAGLDPQWILSRSKKRPKDGSRKDKILKLIEKGIKTGTPKVTSQVITARKEKPGNPKVGKSKKVL